MREIIKRILREESQKNDSIKNSLFRYWDKNGPSIEDGEYLSLSEDETSKYLIEYHGDNIEELITNEVKERIESYRNCDGDEFKLRFDGINFEWAPKTKYVEYNISISNTKMQNSFYNVTISIDINSEVFHSEFDYGDHENILTLYGQIEGCVEEMLNNTVYNTYGVPVLNCMVNGVYDSNI
jgi:hypothetical protein